ncbi:DUF2927 domain-containing protein [Vannielia litorea]|uniref:DUF2927 domain-containing protein n=1 Tax=Vannielia litorea TaxID=1217970 RepID=UPI001C95123D|nr:DUF2927 domain-containing protein [Vannielia litorea]MBY6047562.1 DUF2927 domain-containing protein [Vannielia litorea]MBY6074976.1 DUF2927 domain-containing protein [Vannielia litorea]
MLNRLLPAGLALVLAACSTSSIPDVDVPQRRASYTGDLPAMRTFSTPRAVPTYRSNAQLAADFLELSFQMESGRKLPQFSRFEGPVTIAVKGAAPASLTGDLSRLVARLRSEARIDVHLSRGGEAKPSITVQIVPKRELQRLVPQAACFVVPRVSSWSEFRKARRSRTVDWASLGERQQIAVFLPGDVSPQEVRDCLHEEIAQALGPLNDLYRLPDSVFNDDNFHTVLTGFDMLMLRAYYDPSLHSGMSREQVAARLPAIFGRINPGGNRGGGGHASYTPRAWIDSIEAALGPRARPSARLDAAKRAVNISKAQGWRDNRAAFSLYALGRLALSAEPELALASFIEASRLYRNNPETQIQAAHVAMQLAAFSLSSGQADGTIGLIDEVLPAVRRAENAALLSTLLLLKAEAYELMGRTGPAAAVRTEALGWARYGFGADSVVRARAGEISALTPSRRPRFN